MQFCVKKCIKWMAIQQLLDDKKQAISLFLIYLLMQRYIVVEFDCASLKNILTNSVVNKQFSFCAVCCYLFEIYGMTFFIFQGNENAQLQQMTTRQLERTATLLRMNTYGKIYKFQVSDFLTSKNKKCHKNVKMTNIRKACQTQIYTSFCRKSCVNLRENECFPVLSGNFFQILTFLQNRQ